MSHITFKFKIILLDNQVLNYINFNFVFSNLISQTSIIVIFFKTGSNRSSDWFKITPKTGE